MNDLWIDIQNPADGLMGANLIAFSTTALLVLGSVSMPSYGLAESEMNSTYFELQINFENFMQTVRLLQLPFLIFITAIGSVRRGTYLVYGYKFRKSVGGT